MSKYSSEECLVSSDKVMANYTKYDAEVTAAVAKAQADFTATMAKNDAEFTEYITKKLVASMGIPMDMYIGEPTPKPEPEPKPASLYLDTSYSMSDELKKAYDKLLNTSYKNEFINMFNYDYVEGCTCSRCQAKGGYTTTNPMDPYTATTLKYVEPVYALGDGTVSFESVGSSKMVAYSTPYANTNNTIYKTWTGKANTSLDYTAAQLTIDPNWANSIVYGGSPLSRSPKVAAKETPKPADPLDDLGIRQKAFLQRAMAMLDIMEGNKFWTEEETAMARKIGWQPKSEKIPNMSDF